MTTVDSPARRRFGVPELLAVLALVLGVASAVDFARSGLPGTGAAVGVSALLAVATVFGSVPGNRIGRIAGAVFSVLVIAYAGFTLTYTVLGM